MNPTLPLPDAYAAGVPRERTPAALAAVQEVVEADKEADAATKARRAAIERRAKAIAKARKEGATFQDIATALGGLTVERVRQMERA